MRLERDGLLLFALAVLDRWRRARRAGARAIGDGWSRRPRRRGGRWARGARARARARAADVLTALIGAVTRCGDGDPAVAAFPDRSRPQLRARPRHARRLAGDRPRRRRPHRRGARERMAGGAVAGRAGRTRRSRVLRLSVVGRCARALQPALAVGSRLAVEPGRGTARGSGALGARSVPSSACSGSSPASRSVPASTTRRRSRSVPGSSGTTRSSTRSVPFPPADVEKAAARSGRERRDAGPVGSQRADRRSRDTDVRHERAGRRHRAGGARRAVRRVDRTRSRSRPRR